MTPEKNDKNVRLSINSVLITLFVLTLTPALFFTYQSINEASQIHARVLDGLNKDARSELEFALGNIATEAVEIAIRIGEWDETRQQLSDHNDYPEWKKKRLKEIGRFQPALTNLSLFLANGEPLDSENDFVDTASIRALSTPSLIRQNDRISVQYFHPLLSTLPSHHDHTVVGYVGVRLDLPTYLNDRFLLRYSSSVSWLIAANEPIAIQHAIEHARLAVTPSNDVQALNDLVTKRFRNYLFYLFAIVAIVIGLIVLAFARPLRRLSNAIQTLRDEKISAVGDDTQGRIGIKELDNVRLAINDYHRRFHQANQKLLEKNQELLQLTYRDTLTGTFNRRAFETHLENTLKIAQQEGRQHALLYLDLDQFKIVNDMCGHLAGDELLRQISARLQNEIREADLLARLGGDEFGVILENCPVERATSIAQNLCNTVQELRFSWNDKLFDVGVSIGLVPFGTDSGSITELLAAADSACYVAKDLGRNRVHVYQDNDTELTHRIGQMQWTARINHALEHRRFALFGQKIMSIQNDLIPEKIEILLRLREDNGDYIPPMAFIPAAERYSLMTKIDRWVVSETLRYISNHPTLARSNSMVSINLSGQSLGDAGFLAFVLDELSRTDLAPNRLCFEITETAAITNLTTATELISKLRQRGCLFALDDFGSGLSSFGYLKTLSVDFLKIDGHFVRNMLHDPLSYSIVDSINQIGHVMGLTTIAEFVESTELLSVLRDIQIDYAQGYHIAQPELLV